MSRPLLITQTSSGGSARLAANWVSSLAALGIANGAVIFCTDSVALETLGNYCKAMAINACCVQLTPREFADSPEPGEHPYGTKYFIRYTLWKLDLLVRLSERTPFEPFLFCDPDVVLLRDPVPALRGAAHLRSRGVSFWFASDRPDDERPDPERGEYCTGVIYQNAPELDFWTLVYRWLSLRMPNTTDLDGSNFIHDQTAANAVLIACHRRPGLLPVSLFRNGAQPWDGEPVLIHCNWAIGNDVKERRLRDSGLWFADDAVLLEVES